MENSISRQMDIEKLTVLLPYWLKHNRQHIRDQEIWFEEAQKAGLLQIAAELEKVIDHSKMINRHIENAIFLISNYEGLEVA